MSSGKTDTADYKPFVFPGEKARKNKYGVAPKASRTLDGFVFDSKLEMSRYAFLKTMQQAGRITELECQVPLELLADFTFQGKKVRGIRYLADFSYRNAYGHKIHEDTKSQETQTAAYKLKKKLLLFRYPDIRFFEITNAEDAGGLV